MTSMPSARNSEAMNSLACSPKMLSGAASGVVKVIDGCAPRRRSSPAVMSASSYKGSGQLGPAGHVKARRGRAARPCSSMSSRKARTSPGPRKVSAPGTAASARAPIATSSTS